MNGFSGVVESAARGVDGVFSLVTGIVTALIVLAVVIVIVKLCYKKVPPNQAFIISGLNKKPRFVSGRATFTVPVVQRIDKLNLGLIQSSIETSAPVPTADFIEVSVSAVVNFQVASEAEQLEKAQRNFLNFTKDEISKIASEVLEGSMREIIGQMFIKDMVTDRETFNARVIQTAKPDLSNMGLNLISFNVQNFQDGRGVIEKLGMDQTAQITRDAAIARIEADREVELKNAEARDVTNERNTKADRAIAEREQELAVMKAQLQIEQDTKKAEADLAYQIQTETKTRELEIAKQEAAIAKQEKEIELKEREVLITERQLEADVKKRAEADRYAKQQAAEASLFEVQKRAEAEKSQADAERYRLESNARAQAEVGKAEASVIEAKGQAEAKANELQGIAIANALKEQADAYNDMQNPYALLEKYIEALPLIARAVADPLSRVGNITMYGEGNVAGLVEETTRTTSQINAAVSEGLGFDIQGLLNGVVTGRAIGNGMASAPQAAVPEPNPQPRPAAPTRKRQQAASDAPAAQKPASPVAKPASSPVKPPAQRRKKVTVNAGESPEEVLARRFENDLVSSEGSYADKTRLANAIADAYSRAKLTMLDEKTAAQARGVVFDCLEKADLSTLNSREDAFRFVKETLVPRLIDVGI